MKNFCRIFPSEYGYEYIAKNQERVPLYIPPDCLRNQIIEWDGDSKSTSKLDPSYDNAEELIKNLALERLRTVYQVSYKNPWTWRIDDDYKCRKTSQDTTKATTESKDMKEKDFSNQILENIRQFYFNPHTEKVLSLPATAKRIIGYVRPRLLHTAFSTYQDSHSRVGGKILIKNNKKVNAMKRRQALKMKGENILNKTTI